MMTARNISCLIAIFTILSVPTNAQETKYNANDLNDLMAKVWQKCKTDLDNLRYYIFNETESWNRFIPVMQKERFDWVWNIKDGYIGPSIDKINGKKIQVGKNNKYPRTLTWDPDQIEQYVNDRQYHPSWEKWDSILDFFDDLIEGHTEPHYNNRIFERLEYKPREYRYMGSRNYAGHNVIEISYPSFAHGGLFKVAPTVEIRMLVIPDENQLVVATLSYKQSGGRTTYTMTMDNSHDNVWLPKEFKQVNRSSMGNDEISREFNSYAKTDVKAKFWFEDVTTRIRFDMDTPPPKQ